MTDHDDILDMLYLWEPSTFLSFSLWLWVHCRSVWSPAEFYWADVFLLFPPPPHSRGWGWCLDDAPQKEKLTLNSLLPGVLYSAAHQCRLQYGSGSVLCDDMDVRLCNEQRIRELQIMPFTCSQSAMFFITEKPLKCTSFKHQSPAHYKT